MKNAASAVLKPPAGVVRVDSARAADSEGREALRVTIVLKRGRADNIRGDDALDMLVGIDRALQAAGDQRFPIIDYVTEEELESEPADDTES